MKSVKIEGAKMFVIPNRMDNLGWYRGFGSPLAPKIEKIAAANSIECDDSTRVVDIWMYVPGVTSDLNSHGISVTFEQGGEEVPCIVGTTCLPKDLIKDLKEGDATTIKIPAYVNRSASDEIMLEITVTASQSDSRYRKWGSFEEVVQKVS